MPYAEDSRLNYASQFEPSAQAQRDYLTMINRGTERNLGQIADVGNSMADFQKQKYATLAAAPGQIQNKYREGKDYARKQADEELAYNDAAMRNQENRKLAEDAQRKREFLAKKAKPGVTREEEAWMNEMSDARRSRLLNDLKIQELSRQMGTQAEETAYQKAKRGFQGLKDNPKAMADFEKSLRGKMAPEQIAAAKAEALRVDQAQVTLEQANKDASAEGQALRETKKFAGRARGALARAKDAMDSYKERANKYVDEGTAVDDRENFAVAMEELGNQTLADKIRALPWSRGADMLKSVEDLMESGFKAMARKSRVSLEAQIGSTGKYAGDPELVQTYRDILNLEAGKKSKNSYSPAQRMAGAANSGEIKPWASNPPPPSNIAPAGGLQVQPQMGAPTQLDPDFANPNQPRGGR